MLRNPSLHGTICAHKPHPRHAVQCSGGRLAGHGWGGPASARPRLELCELLHLLALLLAHACRRPSARGPRQQEKGVSRSRDGTRVGGSRARNGRSWQHTQESQSWCSGRGRRAQGGTRSSGRLLGLREGGLGRRRSREVERRRLEIDLARHLQRGQTRQRCTLQRNRTAAGALSKSLARTDSEAQAHSNICKNKESKQRVGAAPSRRARSARAPRAHAPARRHRGRPPRPAGGSAEGALSVGRSEESGRRRPVLSNARCGGEVALNAALNRGHCPNETSALIVVVNAGQGRAWCASARAGAATGWAWTASCW